MKNKFSLSTNSALLVHYTCLVVYSMTSYIITLEHINNKTLALKKIRKDDQGFLFTLILLAVISGSKKKKSIEL